MNCLVYRKQFTCHNGNGSTNKFKNNNNGCKQKIIVFPFSRYLIFSWLYFNNLKNSLAFSQNLSANILFKIRNS